GGQVTSDASIGTVNVRSDLIGTAAAPVVLSAVGQATPPSKGADMALKSLKVRGSVEFARVLAGYDSTGSGVNADASIGTLMVGGDWRASTVLSGVAAGIDTLEGTGDDAKLAGPGVRDNTSVFSLISQIASITIKGQAFGNPLSMETYGIVAEQIATAKIGTTTLHLNKGPHSAGDFLFLSSPSAGGTFSLGEARS